VNSGPILFLSAFLTLAGSFWGLVLAPQLQLGRQDLRAIPPSGQLYPSGRLGLAKAGEAVYRAHGCVECHTQQVRPAGYGSDLDRGWGLRRTVAQDYLRDHPIQLGTLRMGPDLANIGVRQPNADWHLKHLYNPKTVVPKSTMPPYAFLFEKQPDNGTLAPDALALDAPFAPPSDNGWIVPTDEARALVAYLLSLRAEAPLFEAPLPPQPESETNAPPVEAASSNATAVASPTEAAARTP